MRRLLPLLLTAGLLAGCSVGVEADDDAGTAPAAAPSAIEGVQVVSGLTREHVERDVTYAQTPPAGGDHWPPQSLEGYGWLRCGVYDEPVVDEFAVHSLEHGAVWLTHRPDADPAGVRALAALAEVDPAYVLVSPVPGQAAAYTATAWGLQLPVEDAADPRLRAFTEAYAGGAQGGEPGADCAGGSTPAQARTALARASGG